jgi:hypothetical protein
VNNSTTNGQKHNSILPPAEVLVPDRHSHFNATPASVKCTHSKYRAAINPTIRE